MTNAAAALTAPAHRSVARGKGLVRSEVLSAGVVLLALLVFANALGNGFVLDDRGIILGNPLVQNLAQSWRAFALPYWPEALGGGQYRPLAILHFAFDWRVSAGSPLWFHASNLVWHALATYLVWRLAAQLLQRRVALICAALFAVHPVHVEAVANVVGRLELMATVFALGTLLAHRAGSRFALALFALGLLSKENAVVTIGLIAANDLLLGPPASDLRPQTSDRRPRLYAGYAAILLLYAATLAFVFHNRPFHIQTGTLEQATLSTRLWTMASVVPHYVRLLLFPGSLSADYEPQVIPTAHGLTGAGAVGLLCVAAYSVGLVAAFKQRRPLAFALAWVAIALAPVANILFVSGVTLAERSLYLPSVGAMLALGFLLQHLIERRRGAAYLLVGVLIVVGSVRTWTRTPVWRDDRTYILTLLTDHPESYRAHWVAGRVHRSAGRMNEAAAELEKARRLFAGVPQLYSEAADVASAMGDPRLAVALRDSARALSNRRP